MLTTDLITTLSLNIWGISLQRHFIDRRSIIFNRDLISYLDVPSNVSHHGISKRVVTWAGEDRVPSSEPYLDQVQFWTFSIDPPVPVAIQVLFFWKINKTPTPFAVLQKISDYRRRRLSALISRPPKYFLKMAEWEIVIATLMIIACSNAAP